MSSVGKTQVAIHTEPEYRVSKNTIVGVYFIAILGLVVAIVAIILIAVVLARQGDITTSLNQLSTSIDHLALATTQSKP